MSKCFYCKNKIETFGNNINVCHETECKYKEYSQYSGDDYVSKKLDEYPIKSRLIIDISIEDVTGTGQSYDSSEVLLDIKNKTCEFLKRKKTLFNECLKINDKEIIDKYGKDIYAFLKTSLYACSFNIIEPRKISDGINIFEIEEDKEFKNRAKGNISYGYHGSSMKNWRSILINGLKNMSNTKFMANAAAYGSGSYLSNSSRFSMGYSNRNNNSGNVIIGVFQVINMEKYEKSTNIYVVPDINEIRLSHLIVFNTNSININNVYKELDIKFNSVIHVNQKKGQIFHNRHFMKRMNKEIEIANKLTEEGNFVCDIDMDDVTEWKIQIKNIDESSDLYKDMKRKKIDYIELNVTFTEKFPFEPPFIRIVKPQFASYTGRITQGGAICMELLTPSGWSAGSNIEVILLSIKVNIIEGGGRLDFNGNILEYTKENAKVSFDRLIKTHEKEWS